MAEGLFDTIYNPDVLSCLANLSNDEVFTPPDIANQMLDMLPQELFSDPNTTFLDPACKSGVFLREIAKRLIVGLEPVFPDLQERVDHILHNQLFGIAITELTSLMSRRSVYCSKYPNSEFSVSRFDDVEGNIRFRKIKHTWKNKKCIFCGASQDEYDRDDDLETHAYEWIHTRKPEEIFGMNFDVIIGNPPYQLSTGGGQDNSARQAKPIYHLFVTMAKKLKPRFLTMIIPARWFAGGIGLDSFRNDMMSDRKITHIVDFPNAKDCFPQNSISGGVCYFLWEKDAEKDCEFTSVNGDSVETMTRPLGEFETIVRYNRAVQIIHKVRTIDNLSMSKQISSISPFGIPTKVRGTEKARNTSDIKLFTSSGEGFIQDQKVYHNNPFYNAYKVLISQTSAEHAGEPGKDGAFRVLTSSMQVIEPTDVCNHSYILAGPFRDRNSADNAYLYFKTKFVRFLLLQSLTSIHISKSTFDFVPLQDFTRSWTDADLYAKYNLTNDEIAFIESMIKPMDLGGDDNA